MRNLETNPDFMKNIILLSKKLSFLLLLVTFTANAQSKVKVTTRFDSVDTAIKEEYYVLADNKEVIDGDYKSYYRSGKLKTQGKFEKGNMVGKYRKYYESGALEVEVMFIDGKRQGKFTEYYENNGKKKIEYNYADDKKEGEVYAFDFAGKVIQKGKYHNDALQDSFFTYFDEKNPNGNIKKAITYVNHIQHGKEINYYENGNPQTEVNYVDGELSADSLRTFFDNGQLEMEVLKDNNRFSDFKNFSKNGKLISEGKVMMKNKSGFLSYSNTTQALAYLGAVLHGQVKTYYDNGAMKAELNYSQGKKSGKNVSYFENGQKKEIIDYSNDEKNREIQKFYPNGEIESETNYKDNTPVGTWEFFYANKQLKYREIYTDGKIDGAKITYHENGKIASEENFIKGKQNGMSKSYYLSGKVKTETPYIRGNINGIIKNFYENGKLQNTGRQLNNTKVGKWNYYSEQGKLEKSETWKKGEVVEVKIPNK